ncbi:MULTISPECIES: T9SS type A sorting domain-containing protein [Flavobacteriaceae]|uniref:T9SS type A sorting domain-containing protein n=1 Tax=Maribacter flavus TaxID=1658664 RepID=A0ABU7IKT0_9FLAO|nr:MULTISPECIES: T9SS type A sorting domain-containing protein [Flavobacteriaceae]MDC6406333.1 M43 family zinc metalloprotease [Maribacter sp. PR66]MEE1973453.1 T9SS type A sorting domain-containing protein [Maribacter flavus]NDV17719.1 hypothetical protein [Muricauda sp. TY007]
MKKNYQTLFILICLCYCSANSQTCGTETPTVKNTYPSTETSKQKVTNYCIDVQFHVIKESNGTNAFVAVNRNAVIDELNDAFNDHNIFFNSIGTNFINNSNYVNIDDKNELDNLMSTDNNPNALNYYIVETLYEINGQAIAGLAYIPSNNLTVINNSALSTTSPHEVGHCLDLYHTHETYFGTENINGDNCGTAGDLVCDTPADPQLGTGNVTAACIYTGGGGYTPLTHNIMSYSRHHCRDHFTSSQGVRMRQALISNSILQNFVNTFQMSGLENLCSSGSYSIIGLPPGATINWDSSSNITRISSQGSNPCTFSRTGTGSTGWIRATISNPGACGDGMVITQNVNLNSQNLDLSVTSVEGEGAAIYVSGYVSGGSSPFKWYINSQLISTTTSRYFSYRYECEGGSSQMGVTSNCGSDYAYYYEDCSGGHRMAVYPNPAFSEISVSMAQENQIGNINLLSLETMPQIQDVVLTLLDFSGNAVKEIIYNGPVQEMKMDVSALSKGIYFLRVVGKKVDEIHTVIIE